METNPTQTPANIKQKKALLLGLVVVIYLLVITPLIIFNAQSKQETRSHAQSAGQTTQGEISVDDVTHSAQALCTSTGGAQIGFAYTNTDPSRSVTVIAAEPVSGKSVYMGTIAPNTSKTGFIDTGKSSVSSGQIQFTLSFSDNPNNTSIKSATFGGITCSPAKLATTVNATSVTSAQPVHVTSDAPATCGNVTTDVMLIIDRSGSMSQANKLVQAKSAAKNFIDVVIKAESTTRIGLVSFSNTSTLNSGLSTNYTNIKNQIDSLSAEGNTCQECGIAAANNEIATNGRSGVKKVVIMLTDGQANWILGGNSVVDTSVGEAKALAAVKSGFNASHTVFFTIGLGIQGGTGDSQFFSPDYMRQVAETTGGKFYFPAPSELDGVYQDISQLIGKGLLGGVVFNDANLNGVYDSNEQKLPGWMIQAISGTTTKTASSDASGNYTIAGLCDGSYKLSEVTKSGWRQTLPSDPSGYAVTISNASQYNDKHFGNTDKSRCNDGLDNDGNGLIDSKDSSCHTDGNPGNPNSYDPSKNGENGGGTCDDGKDNNNNGQIDGADPRCHTDGNANNPGTYDPKLSESTATTSFSLTVSQHGIGNSGDNSNPTSTMSNKSPKHPSITSDLTIYDSNNKPIGTNSGTLTYSTQNGNYTGVVSVTSSALTSGKYTLKVGTQYHLKKFIAGIQTINAGQNNTNLTPVTLVAGDSDGNNKINILDYNLLLNCYSDLVAASACTTTKKTATDYNDDGSVNQIDYNLFLREIATQPGE